MNLSHFRIPILVLALWAPARAQSPRLQIQGLEKLAASASEVVDITLDGATLRMATQFLGEDKETKGIVDKLQGIYVKTFEFEKADAYSKADVESIRAQLQPPAWNRIVGVQSRKDGDVGVFVMGDPDQGGIRGLAILVTGPKELVVVNLVGPIDLKKLGALEGKLGIPKIGDGKEHRDGKK